MRINEQHYDKRFGTNHRIILRNSELLGSGLVFLSKNVAPDGGWIIRSFDSRGEFPNSNFNHTLEEIIQGADYSEFPPAYSIKNYDGWALYLKLRTKAVEDFARSLRRTDAEAQLQGPLDPGQDPYDSNETS